MAVNENGVRLRSHVYRSMASERMVDGVHFSFFMVNTGLLFFILTSFKFFYWIPVYYTLHKALGFLGKKDPIVLQVYVRYTMQAFKYQAWPSPIQRLGGRPSGYGGWLWHTAPKEENSKEDKKSETTND